MKRWLTILVALVVVFAAIVFSVINRGAAALDLYVAKFDAPVGVLILASLFLGCLIGGLVLYPGVIVPLKMRVTALRRELERRSAPPPP